MLIYIAGGAWDGVVGTDRQLASAISRSVPVLWVDPPVPVMQILRGSNGGARSLRMGLDKVDKNICRLRVLGPPGVTRPILRSIASVAQRSRISRLVARLPATPIAVVLATPEGRFPSRVRGRKIYYVTDDWAEGAEMMGLDRNRIGRLANRNLQDADTLAAVSPSLLHKVLETAPKHLETLLLANGCDPAYFADSDPVMPEDVPGEPFAVLIGQINERLDLDAVREVADRALRVVVVGPRTERDPRTAEQLDHLFAHPMVTWLGPRRLDQLYPYLRAATVGLTPYKDNAFNRASFPLKTLEYLAAGLPVVSSDLPAARWLNTDLISIARSAEEFAAKACFLAENDTLAGRARASERQNFARGHSWDARARSLLTSILKA